AADARHVANAGRSGAGPPRGHLTDRAAAVAGRLVAVVARLALIHHAVAALAGIADFDHRDIERPTVEMIAGAAGTGTAVGVGLRCDTSTTEAAEQNCHAYKRDEMPATHLGDS